MTKDPVE